MNNKSYWIWHYGDYEIFHTMNVHLRIEAQTSVLEDLSTIYIG